MSLGCSRNQGSKRADIGPYSDLRAQRLCQPASIFDQVDTYCTNSCCLQDLNQNLPDQSQADDAGRLPQLQTRLTETMQCNRANRRECRMVHLHADRHRHHEIFGTKLISA